MSRGDSVYRIYSEDGDREAVIEMGIQRFGSFTVHPAAHYFRDSLSNPL
jgi:hypothetical protein